MTQPVKFGLNVDPNTGGLPIAERIAAIADASALDLVGIQDHPYNADFTDTLTLITWLAARTRQVHLFPNVANLPLRPPAMLAKQAATLDVLSGGRFELGLGAGAFPDGIAGMGGPRELALDDGQFGTPHVGEDAPQVAGGVVPAFPRRPGPVSAAAHGDQDGRLARQQRPGLAAGQAGRCVQAGGSCM